MADDQTPDEDQVSPDKFALRRRMLLKAAVGTGVAVAAHSAPRVSVVPAYGLTSTSGLSTPYCFAIGWSSNNPTGKGWMKLSDQDFGSVPGPVKNPTGGPGSHAGQGTAVYTWNVPAFPSIGTPAFTLTLTTTGCVNTGAGKMTPSGMPSGYCLKFYNSGNALKKDTTINTCATLASSNWASPGGQVSSTTVKNGQTVSISSQGEATCEGSDQGKISWVFDIGPC